MNPSVHLECPECQAKFPVKNPDTLGKRIRCPKCEEVFLAEAPRAAETRRPPKGKKPAPASEEKDRPRKKKMKPPGMKLILIIGGIGVGVILLLLGSGVVALLLFLRQDPATTPTSYDTYRAEEDEFQCQYPAGWKVAAGGPKNHRMVTFTKDGASIRIRQSLAGSLIGDVAKSRIDAGAPDDLSPVAVVHEFKKTQIADEMSNYKEQRAETVQTKFGKGRRSEFTAMGTLPRKVCGYRATALAPLLQYDIICQCPEGDWPALRAAFAKVIESLGP